MITAVGMVNHLPVMMAAVVIAMAVMLLASKPLTRFVNQHPTVVVLCLSFLLMIGRHGGGRVWFPYSERLPVRGNWFLDRYRGV